MRRCTQIWTNVQLRLFDLLRCANLDTLFTILVYYLTGYFWNISEMELFDIHVVPTSLTGARPHLEKHSDASRHFDTTQERRQHETTFCRFLHLHLHLRLILL